MKTKVTNLLKGTTGRYIGIGLAVYILELILIMLAQKLGASSTVAVALSFWAGLLLSFFLQKIVTFKDARMHHKIVLPQLLAASLLVLFNFGFTLLVTHILRTVLPAVGTRTVALGMTTLWNFYIYQTKIFKTSDIRLVD